MEENYEHCNFNIFITNMSYTIIQRELLREMNVSGIAVQVAINMVIGKQNQLPINSVTKKTQFVVIRDNSYFLRAIQYQSNKYNFDR